MIYYVEPAKKLPVRECDVVIAGGGTAGVVAAIASARQGAKTILIESKGYPGGIAVEGGTALHSFYNLWKAFPGVERRQVVKGIPQEIVDRLMEAGGTSGHADMVKGFDYDSVCTAIVRVDGDFSKASKELADGARKIGMSAVVTSVHDDYFMFVKLNYRMAVSPTNRDEVAKAELELRKRQIKDGGTYGIPYRALLVAGIDNLFAAGMMITSDRDAHTSPQRD